MTVAWHHHMPADTLIPRECGADTWAAGNTQSVTGSSPRQAGAKRSYEAGDPQHEFGTLPPRPVVVAVSDSELGEEPAELRFHAALVVRGRTSIHALPQPQ